MLSGKRTKIIATIGPSCDTKNGVRELIGTGVNVFRFNLKHNSLSWHKERLKIVREVAKELSTDIGTLIDLQGPEIRIKTKEKRDFPLKKGDEIIVTNNLEDGEGVLEISETSVFDELVAGDILLIDDGLVELKVKSKTPDKVIAVAVDSCTLRDRKSLSLPGKKIGLPSLEKKDLDALDAFIKEDVDFVALSFCRDKEDIIKLRNEMEKREIKSKIIAKIESRVALENLEEIIENSDGVMVARGDLGVETPIEELAHIQKLLINKCRIKRKPVIVATQMLQSMVENPKPTRAEATDVANAVYDGTDAVMLSGETATGKYPVKAVLAMSKILEFNEQKADIQRAHFRTENETEMVIDAAVDMIAERHKIKIDSIIVFTETGYTARALSSLRPRTPIIAVTDNKQTVGSLTLSFGVRSEYLVFPEGMFISPSNIINKLVTEGKVEKKQTVLVVHGQHWKKPGLTNSLSLLTI